MPRRAPLAAAGIEVALFLVVTIFDPFGFVEWAEQRSHDLLQSATASAYPGQRGGQSHVAVDDPRQCASSQCEAVAGRKAITVLTYQKAFKTVVTRSGPGRGAVATKVAFDSLDLLDLIETIERLSGADPLPSPGADIRFTHGHPPAALLLDFDLSLAARADMTAQALIPAGQGETAQETGRIASDCVYRQAQQPRVLSPFRCLVRGVAQLTHYDQWRTINQCQDDDLAKLNCIVRSGGVPVIFVVPGRRPSVMEATEPGTWDTPATQALAEVALTVPAQVNVEEYPLRDRGGAAEGRRPDPNRRVRLFPASAMLAAWCASGHCSGPLALARLPSPLVRAGERAIWEAPLNLQWAQAIDEDVEVEWAVGKLPLAKRNARLENDPGLTLDPESLLRSDGPCTSETAGRWVLRNAVYGIMPKVDPPCPYHLPYGHDVFEINSITLDQERALTADRLIVIGGAAPGSSDMVPAAPYGLMPGVYLHAMALDNLVEFGAGYPRPPHHLIGGLSREYLWNVPLLCLTVVVVGIAVSLLERRAPGAAQPQASGGLARGALWRIGIVALAVMVIGLLYLATLSRPLSIIPANFNSVEGLVFAARHVLELVWEAAVPIREMVVLVGAAAWAGARHALDPPLLPGTDRVPDTAPAPTDAETGDH